jgi:uncharacterized protein HemY
MLASGIAQKTREHDLDKEEKLKRAEGLANQALQVIDKAEKPRPDISEEQWAAVKKDSVAQAHEALGIAAVVRKKYDVAVNEFKASIDSAAQPDPGTMVRLVSAYNASGKSDEAIAMADKVLATPNLHPQIKAIAESEKANAAKAKAAKKP